MNNTSQIQESGLFHDLDLPKIWKYTTVNEITDFIQYGHTASAKKNTVGPKFLRITDIQDSSVNWSNVPYCEIPKSEIKKYLLEPGDLVFARTGATVGKSYLIKENIPEAIFASYLIRLRISPLLNRNFVYYFFQSPMYWNQITRKKIGTGQPNVNGNLLKTIILPISPLREQNRIVSKLDELFTKLDAGIEYLKKTQIMLKQYRQSVLKYAFDGKLTERWRVHNKDQIKGDFSDIVKLNESKIRDKHNGSQHTNSTHLSRLPEGWCWINFSTIILKVKRGPSMKCNQDARGMRYITSGNLEGGRLDLSKDFKFLEGFRDIERCRLLPGDLILNCVNSLEQIGKSAVFESSHGNAIVGFNNYALELDRKFVLPHYINFVCQSEYFRRQVYFMIKRAINQVSFAIDELKRIVIPLLSISEQQRVVDEIERQFSIVENNEKSIEINLKQAKKLRASVLRTAFEGKLVPQEPNDESADILLERIKAQKLRDITEPKISRRKNKFAGVQSRLM